MHQRPSRCWTCANVSAATSDRRSPQPRRTARMARSRRPLTVVMSGAFRSACACRSDSQLPDADAGRFRALHARDSGRQFRREQAVVRRLGGQLADRRHPDDDRRRAKLAVFQRYPPRAHGGLGEAGPRRLLEPGQELVQRHVIHAFRNRRGDAVEHQRLQFLPSARSFPLQSNRSFWVLLMGIIGS